MMERGASSVTKKGERDLCEICGNKVQVLEGSRNLSLLRAGYDLGAMNASKDRDKSIVLLNLKHSV